MAENPDDRLAHLQIGNPRLLTLLHVEKNAGHMEHMLHVLLEPMAVRGERITLDWPASDYSQRGRSARP